MTKSDPPPLSTLLFAHALLALSAFSLLGWALDRPDWTTFGTAILPVNPGAAVAGILAACGLYAYRRGLSPVPFGAGVIAIGFSRMVAYATGFDLGLDAALFANKLAYAPELVARMAPNTAAACLFLGTGLIALAGPGRTWGNVRDTMAVATSQVGMIALVCYFYQATALIPVADYVPMSLGAALLFTLASVSLFAVRPTGGFLESFLAPGDGGRLLRWSLPAAALLLVGAGWLRLAGEAAEWYRIVFGTALMTVATLWAVGFLLFHVARGLERSAEAAARHAHEQDAATTKAEEASRSKGLFLATMSHELRTPLNAIIGYSEMLREDAEMEGRIDIIDDLVKITGAGRHLLGMIDGILDLAKIEAGKMELHDDDVAVAGLVAEAASTIGPAVAKAGSGLRIEIAGDVPRIRTDAQKLRQILLNLLSNAAKFTENGTITLTVARATLGDVPAVAFGVTDTGIGMSPEQQAHVFQAFTQAELGTTRRYGGTGLGLTLSRHFAEAMGGTLSLESALGVGTTFTITLPVTRASSLTASVPAQAIPSALNAH